MTGPDDNLTELGALWRAQEAPRTLGPELVARIRRQSRLMWLTTLVEVAILAALAAFTAWFTAAGLTIAEAVLLGGIWLLAIGMMAFSLWNRRGSWQAPAERPADYLELLVRRARAKLRAALAVRILVVVQAAAVVGLVAAAPDASARRSLLALALAALLALAYGAWSVWYGARARRELDAAVSARQLLRVPPSDESPELPQRLL